MTISDLEHFKILLNERRENITDWAGSFGAARPEDLRKVQSLLGEMQDALKRIDDQTYGTCKVCHQSVELHRLEVQPVTAICLGCITREEQETLEQELYLASKIHRALLPQTVADIDGYEVAVKALASRMVGGDYYDFLQSANGRLSRVIIADTMGKGIPAGLLMSNIQGALRILAEEIDSPSELVTRLNRWLCRNVPVTKFVSMVCVAIENGDGSQHIVYTNAGHNLPMVVRGNGEITVLESTGGVIGVHNDFSYEEKAISLGPGEMLVLYTDGVTEASNGRDEMFGEDRLMEFVSRRRADTLNSFLAGLLSEIRTFTGKSELDDDLTVIALRRT